MVNLIPRQRKKTLFSGAFLTLFSLLTLLGVGMGFVILVFLERNARSILESIEVSLEQNVEVALRSELQERKKTLDDFSVVAAERGNFLSMLDVVERTTHKDIFFTGFESDGISGIVEMSGVAKNFFVLEQQRLLWSQNEEIGNAIVEILEFRSDGRILFHVALTL